jgi:SAM-dependent methyltransferase
MTGTRRAKTLRISDHEEGDNMSTTSDAATGSSATQGQLWGAKARDWTTLEPKQIALYESALENIDVGEGTRLLDVGCGTGLFLRLAAQRGATVSGLDAAAPFIDITRERVPDAELHVGEMEALPWPDDSFDVITGFNAFQFAADPAHALREAGRVARKDAPIVIATWGRPDQCEAAGYVKAVGSLLPPPPPGTPGPFALSEDGAIEAFAERGGLKPGERRDVLCVWAFADDDEALRALKSTGFAVRASQGAGEDAVSDTVLEAIAPYQASDGSYRLENVFTYLIAYA